MIVTRGAPDRECIDRRGNVVHAHDGRAAVDRGERGGNARREAVADGAPRELPKRGLARPADKQRKAGCEQFALAAQ